ncbi:MAG: acetyl-CoA carboxylase, biotin carboxyl carrier protein [Coriobacteriales bacterium]|jgi:acetyl-CoA carboxylase biotin carboxyl carrier protein|nr:acetyl-CoA carboxylase, biotin carboxyl carrier protein [Coriobacteriales bacterium]
MTTIEQFEELATFLEKHRLTRLEYEQDGLRVVLEKSEPPVLVSSPAPPPATPTAFPGDMQATPASPATSSIAIDPIADSKTVVKAPLVGIAYRARSPKEASLVEVGQQVQAGDPLCLIEAMKLFNEVTAPLAGVIIAINFENGALVEYGAPLVTIG